jgi:hypothetical protein
LSQHKRLASRFLVFKAWKIKNTIDLSFQLRRTRTETLTVSFPEGTTAGEIEATLTYHHRPGRNSSFIGSCERSDSENSVIFAVLLSSPLESAK